MNSQMLAFADALRKHAAALGPMDGVEWHMSGMPVDYAEAVAAMEGRVAAIKADTAPELIWLLEHPALYTAGTSAQDTDLLEPGRLPVYKTGRGGQYTYHGPGQLVAYVMLDLNRRGRDVRCHVHRLEAWVIAALADYGVIGTRRKGAPGIWVAREERPGREAPSAASPSCDERTDSVEPPAGKIAALGVRVRHWITFHGVAVNVNPNLEHFSGIVPCGISDAGVTSLAALRNDEKCRLALTG